MEIIIRQELPEEYWETEYMTKKAFWNLHFPGCNEHYLVHRLRSDKAYIPELSRVAVADGKIVGTIMYSAARSEGAEGSSNEVLCFGPLCVDPVMQNMGIGGLLLNTTMQLAREEGYPGIVIFGEPGYYPKFGFQTCDHYGITTAEGKNFDAFMGIELVPGGLRSMPGRFFEAEVFESLTEEETEAFDKGFPYMEKLRLPGQWDYDAGTKQKDGEEA